MPVDIIEMFWGCTTCNAKNLGRHKTCDNCGAPRTDKSPEWMPGDISPMAAVKDPALLRKFKAGADWKCKYCGSSQFRADGACAQCGSEQGDSTGKPRVHKEGGRTVVEGGTVDQEFLAKLSDSEPDPFKPESTPDPFITEGGYREAPKRAPKRATPPPVSYDDTAEFVRVFPRFPNLTRLLAIGGGILALGLLLYFIFRTKIVDTKVTAVQWTYTVAVDRYQVWSREGWDPDYGAFDTHNLGPRIHHYDHVRVGSHQEHYTERVACGQDCSTTPRNCSTTPRNCTSNKNGSATCTGGDTVCTGGDRVCTTRYCNEPRTRTVDDYEEQPRYRDWYSWHVWDWGHNRNVLASGATTETHWPSEAEIRLNVGLAPGEKEREAGRQEVYQITLFGDKAYDYTPKSLIEFQKFTIGSQHKIKVGVAHGVEVLPPK